MNNEYTAEQLKAAQDAWEARHPEHVSKPEFDRDRTAWVSGYIASENDLIERLETIVGPLRVIDPNTTRDVLAGLAGERKNTASGYGPVKE